MVGLKSAATFADDASYSSTSEISVATSDIPFATLDVPAATSEIPGVTLQTPGAISEITGATSDIFGATLEIPGATLAPCSPIPGMLRSCHGLWWESERRACSAHDDRQEPQLPNSRTGSSRGMSGDDVPDSAVAVVDRGVSAHSAAAAADQDRSTDSAAVAVDRGESEESAPSSDMRSRRAPTTKRMPTSLAAICARTTPASVLRSVSASADRPSSAARRTSSSGCDPPRKNEKLLVICSSA